jgi:hypothetical protein
MGTFKYPLNTTKLSTDVSHPPLPFEQANRPHSYSESIPMLYTKNTFDFESLSDVLKLSQTILPERMRLIKDVQWKQVYPNGDVAYLNHNPINANDREGGCKLSTST